jgi:hypothetical protein
MKLAAVRAFALSLPETTEAPHHHFGSFRVRGKVFVTLPPGETHLHVFVDDDERERALALHPGWVEKLMWGGKVVGVRVALAGAAPREVERLVREAWRRKAPATLRSAFDASRPPAR